MPVASWYGRKVLSETLVEERENTAAALFGVEVEEPDRLAPAELHSRLGGDSPPIILDVRSRSSYESDGVRIAGDVRVRPDLVMQWAADHPPDRPVVAYCT